MMTAPAAIDLADVYGIERLPWRSFLARLDWQQGEHMSLIGPTGGGKSTAAGMLLDLVPYVVWLGSKPKDPTLNALRKRTPPYQLSRSWPPPLSRAPLRGDGKGPKWWKVLLWPRYQRIEDNAKVAGTLRNALGEIFAQGGWTVVADDLNKLCQQLGLGDSLVPFWTDGRSIGLSVVAMAQRPAWVPLYVYSQATHLLFWRTNDSRDLKTIGGLNGVDDRTVREVVARLGRYEVLYVNTRTGTMTLTRVERG